MFQVLNSDGSRISNVRSELLALIETGADGQPKSKRANKK